MLWKNNLNKLLSVYSEFNQEINLHRNDCSKNNIEGYISYLPLNLTYLTFGSYFNQQVNLPFSVQFLDLDCDNVNICQIVLKN